MGQPSAGSIKNTYSTASLDSITDAIKKILVKNTAWNYMRSGYIPSFRVGARYFCHDYVLEEIARRAKRITQEGYNRRSWVRMVWKYEHGEKW